MAHTAPPTTGRMMRLSDALQRRSGIILATFALLTALLVIPLLLLEPDEEASQEPIAAVFELRDEFETRLEPVVHGNAYIVEARDGDILTQAALSELLVNQRALLAADARGELAPPGLPERRYLLEGYSTDANTSFTGVFSVADAVDQRLQQDSRFATTLQNASDAQVKRALHAVLSDPATAELRDQLAVSATSAPATVEGEAITRWSAPAIAIIVLADNALLGGGPSRGGISGDDRIVDKEEFNRNVQDLLRGDQTSYRVWGIAIDQQLTSEEQGQTAGLFIMFAVVGAVGVVGIALRSYWATALTGIGLGVLMVWLGGISNLIGLKGGLMIELIVPIAMVALGVDFAVHALRRYQEEKRLGLAPRRALTAGIAGVGGALVLAMASDSLAFLSNTAAGIESVVHFGIAAAIASVASFLVLGVAVPLAYMRLDEAAPFAPARGLRARGFRLFNGVNAAILAGTVVIITVAVSAAVGAALLALAVGVTIGLPLAVARLRRRHHPPGVAVPPAPATPAAPGGHSQLGRLVSAIAVRRRLALPAAAALTAGAVVLALQLEATFDVKDFFDNSSDFVVSLDKLEEHLGDTGGEPGAFVVEGDLTDPAALAALDDFTARLADNPYVGREEDGDLNLVEPNILSVVRRLMEAPDRVLDATGVAITDADRDGLPDTRAQTTALIELALRSGVPSPDGSLVHTPADVAAVLDYSPGQPVYTVLTVGIPDSREQSTVSAAREAFEADLAPLAAAPGIDRAGLIGSPFEREQTLIATTDALITSLPIAAAAALALLLLVFRSLRYAIVTVIPVGLVAAWLYALMYLSDFSLNFVTATIGAISIGVGIDYSIHMTERFREELRRASSPRVALARAADGTGVALLASAGSTIVGFSIMGLAPMPLFASYGILTAVMVALALAASLLVLPSLLLLVAPATAVEPAAPAATPARVTPQPALNAAGERPPARRPVSAAVPEGGQVQH